MRLSFALITCLLQVTTSEDDGGGMTYDDSQDDGGGMTYDDSQDDGGGMTYDDSQDDGGGMTYDDNSNMFDDGSGDYYPTIADYDDGSGNDDDGSGYYPTFADYDDGSGNDDDGSDNFPTLADYDDIESEGPTVASSSEGPTTAGPTTAAPTTPAPTTPAPTTPAPTTPAPTTPAPTTPAPTTPAPTTPAPTTPAPTTPAPTTAEPTASPTQGIPKCKGKMTLLEVRIKTDNKPKQTTMRVKSRVGSKGKFAKKVLNEKKFDKKSQNSFYACVNTKKFCYQLFVGDKGGDGIKKGQVKMFEDEKKFYAQKFPKGKKLVKKFGKCTDKQKD